MKKMAVGIMSGTSLDGIDVVIASIEGSYMTTQVDVIAFETYPIEEKLKHKIFQAMNADTCSAELMCSLNMELGYAFGNAAKRLCDEHKIILEDISFVSSHGQTIWHINENTSSFIQSSLQLGSASAIASIMKTTVVSDFRNADIAHGGVGAPLVPYVDYILFTDNEKSRSLHNLGGISNLTVLKAQGREEDVIAFDTGPANMMIDRAMSVLFQINYDDQGMIAKSGHVISKLLDELMNHPYLKVKPPKSTGREVFGDSMTDEIIKRYRDEKKEDIISTFTHFTAKSIVKAYLEDVISHIKLDEIIFSGGGAYNSYLIKLIADELPSVKVYTLEDFGFDSKAKEALAFLILGNETLNHVASNMLKATGAKHKAILGQIQYYIK